MCQNFIEELSKEPSSFVAAINRNREKSGEENGENSRQCLADYQRSPRRCKRVIRRYIRVSRTISELLQALSFVCIDHEPEEYTRLYGDLGQQAFCSFHRQGEIDRLKQRIAEKQAQTSLPTACLLASRTSEPGISPRHLVIPPSRESLCRPYKTNESAHDPKNICHKLRRILEDGRNAKWKFEGNHSFQGLTPDIGFIYVYTDDSLPNHLKIGSTTKPVMERIKGREQECRVPFGTIRVPVRSWEVSHPVLVESLVHSELLPERRFLDCECRRNHDEWFEIGQERAQAVIERWKDWMNGKPEPLLSEARGNTWQWRFNQKASERLSELLDSIKRDRQRMNTVEANDEASNENEGQEDSDEEDKEATDDTYESPATRNGRETINSNTERSTSDGNLTPSSSETNCRSTIDATVPPRIRYDLTLKDSPCPGTSKFKPIVIPDDTEQISASLESISLMPKLRKKRSSRAPPISDTTLDSSTKDVASHELQERLIVPGSWRDSPAPDEVATNSSDSQLPSMPPSSFLSTFVMHLMHVKLLTVHLFFSLAVASKFLPFLPGSFPGSSQKNVSTVESVLEQCPPRRRRKRSTV
ncbi:MAG: hypothetical protein LQ340_005106 [Diploschistes diacapsis]|nr:MAG: hypothetical protein LQ340_005106 [Diploschistes diacapsis]